MYFDSLLGHVWRVQQKLEDLEKASTDNAQALHGTSFSQDKMTAKVRVELFVTTQSFCGTTPYRTVYGAGNLHCICS